MRLCSDEIYEQVQRYAIQQNRSLLRSLGHGNDGAVYQTKEPSAIKGFYRESTYQCERNTYQRLREYGQVEILGFEVPQLIDHDDRLWVIEMTTVYPPFVLDFGKVYLDIPPEFSPEIWEDWEAKGVEDFGEARWSRVKEILVELRRLGIYYVDPSPGNINFGVE